MTGPETVLLQRLERKVDALADKVDQVIARVNDIETTREIEARVEAALLAHSKTFWSRLALFGDWALRVIGVSVTLLIATGVIHV
jgi:hypothetical protein